METVKKEKVEKKDLTPKVEGFLLYQGKTPMVSISGNFFRGKFQLSKNKVKAVLDNVEALKAFANGDLDKEILALGADEELKA